MKFRRENIFGYPYYRVVADSVRGERWENPVLGWVEKDALGDGWWSYKTFPNIDARCKLHASRQAAAEYLARSDDSLLQAGEGAPGGGLAAPAQAAWRTLWSENDLLNWVLNTAQMHGWKRAHFRPAKTAKGWRTPVQGDGVGFPDLILVRGCRLVVAELKKGAAKPTVEQAEWLAAFEGVPDIDVFVWSTRTPACAIEMVLA